MAGVEMEPDASHHLNFATDLDEDLITYESDIADRPDSRNDAIWNQQPLESNIETNEEVLIDTGLTAEDTNNKDLPETQPQESINIHQHTLPSYEVVQEPSAESVQDEGPVMEHEGERESANDEMGGIEHSVKDEEAEPIDFFASGDHNVELLEDDINMSIPSGEEAEGDNEGSNESDHEIDYEHNEPETHSFSDNGESLNPAEDGGSGQTSTVTQRTSSEKDHSSNSQDPPPTDTVSGANEEEITWEEGEAAVTNVGSTTEENGLEIHETTAMSHDSEVDSGRMGEEPEVVEYMDEDADGDDTEHHSEDGSNQTHPATTDIVSGDASAASPEHGQQQDHTSVHSDSEHPDFPAITVQYKGDEFPFFSGTADGFFTEPAVLDDDMKSLMAGFRAELANEIATDEELVFQVDELGLEFSESSLNETLSGITLRQILEVFDLLVKNQDPDSSRVLYTYLFTRPSTSKRFESLVESATAGKGLDEVIHLFASPMPLGNRIVVEETLAEDENENGLDVYESAEDMEEAEHADVEDQVVGEEHNSVEEHDDNQVSEGFEASGFEEHHSQADHDDHDGVHTNPQTPASDHQTDSAGTGPTGAESESVHNDTQELSHDQSNLDANEPDDNLPETQHPEGDEPTDYNHAHSTEEEAVAEIAFSEAELAQEAAVETGTTNTLNDDAAELLATDVDLDFTANDEFPQEGLDELAEIDWRHEAEDPDASVDTTLGAGKRPRTDDEPGVDDDKDAKRLRS